LKSKKKKEDGVLPADLGEGKKKKAEKIRGLRAKRIGRGRITVVLLPSGFGGEANSGADLRKRVRLSKEA